MNHSDTLSIVPTVRHDGWTEARKVQFLEHLAGHGDVRAACSVVGMSREAAYKLRRRDALFARAWSAALILAREASAEVLACRAIDGVEEEVWYRGEMAGTRRRYDSRLLLAHMARLDALAESGSASEDAARFDELVALVGGVQPAEALVIGEDFVPLARAEQVAWAMGVAVEMAREEAEENGAELGGGKGLFPGERLQAGADAAAHWDAWLDAARATVDRLVEQPLEGAAAPVRTVSTMSTSPPADALTREPTRAGP